jgi:hypothetical protein
MILLRIMVVDSVCRRENIQFYRADDSFAQR